MVGHSSLQVPHALEPFVGNRRAGDIAAQAFELLALMGAVHFHCCVIDGVFAVGEDGQVHFVEAAALSPEDLAAVQQQVRARVLRWFARAGLLDSADARDMAGWHHGGGFSLDAAVRIEGPDRAGLERLLRYCARPPFALERLEQLPEGQIVYRFPRPQPDGGTELRLTPLELIERLAALILRIPPLSLELASAPAVARGDRRPAAGDPACARRRCGAAPA